MKPRADYETAVLIMREETEGWGRGAARRATRTPAALGAVKVIEGSACRWASKEEEEHVEAIAR